MHVDSVSANETRRGSVNIVDSVEEDLILRHDLVGCEWRCGARRRNSIWSGCRESLSVYDPLFASIDVTERTGNDLWIHARTGSFLASGLFSISAVGDAAVDGEAQMSVLRFTNTHFVLRRPMLISAARSTEPRCAIFSWSQRN